MAYLVGEVARMAGVTIPTLHHYDEIGLLSPAVRTRAGYRRYGDADLERLQQILFYRELGFGLDEITGLLHRGDVTDHLRRQRDLLAERVRRLQDVGAAVQEALETAVAGGTVAAEERFAVFARWRPPRRYADEAERRWGGTAQWGQVRERMAGYSLAELLRLEDEADDWVARLRALLEVCAPADAPAVMDLAEEHRLTLHRWWFDCDHVLHVELATQCAVDPDQLAFLVPPERQLPGMGEFIRDAAAANAQRFGP